MSSEAGHDKPSQRRDRGVACSRTVRKAAIAAGALALSSLAGGCMYNTDAWLWDPSVTGRWENTPTIVPVLERIDIIESASMDAVQVSEVRPEDLQVSATQYRVGPGDVLIIRIFDFFDLGVPFADEFVVDAVGELRLPLIPEPLRVAGLSARQIEAVIGQAAIDAGILSEPEVTVSVRGQLDTTYRIFGAIQRPGIAQIPKPDFRLLDAVIDAGGVSPVIKNIYVIRQVRTDLEPAGGVTPPTQPTPRPTEDPEDILDLIDDITGDGGVDPSMLGTSPNVRRLPDTRLERTGPTNLVDELLAGALDDEASAVAFNDQVSPAAFSQDGQDSGGAAEPVIDLDGSTNFRPTPVGSSANNAAGAGEAGTGNGSAASTPAGRWVFRDGRWVRSTITQTASGQGLPEGEDPLSGPGYSVTQRVIRVPVGPLIDGDARFNIVIRPGDIISVRSPEVGQVYLGGPGISRPGVYSLNGQTTVTLLRGIIAAGDFSAIGIPERVDLTRMVGDNRQATIRLNVRAIANGTAPDIVLKPDDMLNFGTNFWAAPVAVVRSGFRASYGYGFLLDRNFGNDVFGAPPTNQFGQ